MSMKDKERLVVLIRRIILGMPTRYKGVQHGIEGIPKSAVAVSALCQRARLSKRKYLYHSLFAQRMRWPICATESGILLLIPAARGYEYKQKSNHDDST